MSRTLVVILLFLSVQNNLSFKIERIINGTNAIEGEFPYMVSLRSARNPTGHSCGGSLISNQWILTAGHCLIHRSAEDVVFAIGITNFVNGDSHNIYSVSDVIVHPEYNPMTISNDVSLAKLSKPIKFFEKINAVPLIDDGVEFEGGENVVLSGWGLINDGTIPNDLQWANLVVFSMNECRKKHGSSITDTMLCAGVPEGGKGQCSGDSGSPLVHDGKQVGVVSWSVKPCAVYPYPGVYAKVSALRGWIRDVTGV